MDATCAIQASIHVFSLVSKYVSRILGTYQNFFRDLFYPFRLSAMRYSCPDGKLHFYNDQVRTEARFP